MRTCLHVRACAGALTKQEGTQLLSALPQPQLIAITEAMDPAARAEAENTLLAISKSATPRGRRSTIRRFAAAISPVCCSADEEVHLKSFPKGIFLTWKLS